jgi:MerR family transcriptional regulator, thiopeptide resistance regulator
MHTVGELAELAGVTVRTLRHYDEIGLLRPSGRTDAGYRLSAHSDLEHLQEILVWRHLGFPLPEIAALIEDPGHDRLSALRRQRDLVEGEREHLESIAAALDAAISAHEQGVNQEEETMFGELDHAALAEEARERWGHTEAYRESARRSAAYGEQDWEKIRTEAEGVERDFAGLRADGQPSEGDAAQAVAERHRQHITRWFYPVSPQMHRNLAEMYVADERFSAHYERIAPRLARYVHDAIEANATRLQTLVSR